MFGWPADHALVANSIGTCNGEDIGEVVVGRVRFCSDPKLRRHAPGRGNAQVLVKRGAARGLSVGEQLAGVADRYAKQQRRERF